MTEIGLEFLPNSGGEAEGLSDAGIETFRENPFAAVARETGQNSRDARNNPNKPVLLKFDVIQLPTESFPSIDSYKSVAKRCLEKSETAKREKEIGFFRNAVSSLNAERLYVLRIADFNTKGVRGPCEEGTPFHTLAKTDGMSVKEDVSSGGSYGIGKNANFALSDIQTVFISTRYLEGDSDNVLCMGKTQFISHEDSEGRERRRTGYWGRVDGYLPLNRQEDIPEWLRRDEQGTSLFSIGLRETSTDWRETSTNWRHEMTAAILINFFCAIERCEMEFEIDHGKVSISRDTLQYLFMDQAVNDAVDSLNARLSFDAARTLHGCLVDEKTSMQVIEIPELGRVRMHMLLRDDLGYTIGIIRNGMYITDNLTNFNEPFERFPLHKEFAVVIEPESTTESEWFKRLESPRHDTLSADRITDPDLRTVGQRAFTKLAKEIRGRIREAARSQPVSSVDLDEMNEFFVTEGARTEDETGQENDPRAKVPTKIKRAEPIKTPPISRRADIEDDPPGPGSSPGPRPKPKPGPNPKPKSQVPQIELVSERTLIPDLSNVCRRRLFFTSPITSELLIYVYACGLNSQERLAILDSSIGETSGSGLMISCEAGVRLRIDVEFDSPYAGPIEISACVLEKGEDAKGEAQ